MAYIVPWVEHNFSDAIRYQHIVDGIKLWKDSGLIKSLIVSTTPGKYLLIPRLLQDFPQGIRFLPGLKTTQLLPTLDDISGWQKIADEIKRVKTASNCAMMILENETAEREYLLGNQIIDFEKLRIGLSLLPKNIFYSWNPTGTNSPFIAPRMTDLLKIVLQSFSRISFISSHLGALTYINQQNRLLLYNKNKQMIIDSGKQFLGQNLLWFYGVGTQWWQDTQVKQALALIPSNEWALIYPGYERWVDGSKSIIENLKN